MKKTNLNLLLILLLVISILFTACAGETKKAESEGPKGLDAYVNALGEDLKKPEKEFEDKKEESVPESPISSDIRSYEIMIKDTIFKFPMSIEELESLGYSYIGETPLNESKAEPGIKFEALYTNGEHEIIFNLLNMGETETTADNTIVAGIFIQFANEKAPKNSEVTLPHNVTADYCDLNSLKTIYGEPTEVFHESQANPPKASKLIYRKDGSGLHSYTIYVDNEKRLVREIVILSTEK